MGDEFPILCENCLGDNPYLRMLKDSNGGECKICSRPFTIFKWKAGTKGRYKSNVICRLCAKLKNTCQCCILDLQYGIPVQVRDKVIQQVSQQAIKSSDPSANTLALAISNVNKMNTNSVILSRENRQYMMQKAEEAMNSNDGGEMIQGATGGILPLAHEALKALSRSKQPYYERNLAKLCSFFAKGECKRGDECPFRHEMPKDKSDPLSKQNYMDRYYGKDDPVAEKMLRKVMPSMKGDDDSSNTNISSFNPANSVEANDPHAKTVWIGGLAPLLVDAQISEQSLLEKIKEKFLQYGVITNAFLSKKGNCVFLTFSNHTEATNAVQDTYKSCIFFSHHCKVGWAKNNQSSDNKESKQINHEESSALKSGKRNREIAKMEGESDEGRHIQPRKDEDEAEEEEEDLTAAIYRAVSSKTQTKDTVTTTNESKKPSSQILYPSMASQHIS
jgi:pre-mRNA-splicing factor RBM22/SLT11